MTSLCPPEYGSTVDLTANVSTSMISLHMLKFTGAPSMAWKTPKIVEIALGAEINSYASAALK